MRKLTLLIISLFVTLGVMAQVEGGKYYRIKDNASGNYLNAANHDTHTRGPNGGVNVVALNEASDEMIFLAEPSGDGFKLKTKSGYYINGQEWNVDANSTTDGAVLLFEQVGDNYHIKWVSTAQKYLGQTKYFKVENVSGTIYPFCDAAVGAAATWTIEQVTRSEYVHNTYSINRNDRRLNSFTITDAERNLAVSSIQTSQTSPVYVDKTDNVLKTVPGATLSFSAFSYNGTWMHAYAYIDYNKDGFFALFNNNNGDGNGEIVSYNYLNGNNILGVSVNQGNAIANPYGNNNTGISKGMPEFTLPANLPNGEYRMRVKVDWDNIDADYGDMSISSGNTLPGIAHNGGCQCDFTIKVTNEFAKAELGALVEQMNKYSFGAEVGLYSSSEYSHDDLNEIKNNASNFYNGIDDNTPVADIQVYISTLNTVLPTVSLNVPAAGKHYRLKNAVSGNYMSAKSDYSVKMLTNGGAALSTIFFLGENNTLYSYTQEKYLDCQGKNLIAEAKNGEFGPAYNTPTANVVTYKNNSYWTFGNRADGVSIDRGKPDVNATGYNWIFEEVTLPVAAIGDTGYTTLEAAKAAALATTEAVEIVLLAGSDETIVFPANVTINKNGFTADKLAVAVAKVGETLYASIEAAAAAAQAGQTVVLLKDTEETLVLPAGVKLDKSNVTAPNVNEAAAKIGDVLYATLAEAANVATKGQTVTILRSTDETAVFAYGVVIEKAEGVVAPNATNEVAVDVPADVVGNIVNNSGVETETVNGVVGALQNNEAVISKTPTNLPVGAKLVVTLVNIIFESEAPAKVVYDVTPKNGDAEVEPTEEITFRLPVPANWKYAKVYHAGTALEGIYPVQEGNYVEVASLDFSEFAVEIAEPVAKIGDVDYYTFEAALAAAQAGETITLVADVTCTEKPVFTKGGVVNVDINGHKFVSSEKARVRCVASADGAVASNNIKFVRGFGWEVYYKDNADEKFRVFPTLDEAVAYKSGTNAANIYPYEDVVQNKDITFCTTGEQTSTALTNDAGYKTSWDLNGFTVLQETAAGNPLESTVLGEFTLLDSSAEKTGKWIAGAYKGNTGGGPAFIVNRADAHLILQGGTISIARNGDVVNTGGLINTNYGTLTVGGATLQMDDQYGIIAFGGNVVVNSGEFVLGENNSSSVFAMRHYSDASVTINANLGGTLYAHSSATATVNVAGVKYVANGTDYLAPAVGEGLVAQGGVVGYPVAKIGEAGYLTLQAAVEAVKDGETINLIDNVTVSVATAAYNDGTYIDGVRYTGDKSFTVDFNGKTVTDDGCVNDYLIYINNKGEKASEITFTNGTIVSKNGCWSAVCVNSSAATQNVVLNLNGMNITNSNDAEYSGNPVVRVRNLATVNVNDKTVITSNGASYGVAANTDGSTLNINEGATIVQQNSGTTGGNSVFAAVGGKGVINISGGTITSDKFGVHTMTTGTPVINISGGTITAPVALKSSTNGGNGELATINVTGGTINGTLETYTENGKIVVSGGTFSKAVAQEYCAEGFVCEANGDGTYGVQFASYIVLPEGVNSSNYAAKFGDNTVTDGTNYYATLQAAVEAVAGQADAVLYCKPGADVGSLQHAPVTSTLTVYGNGADVTGGAERDFDLGNTDPSGGNDITADMTLTVKHLNGCGAWGAKATEHTVNLVFENCANMGKVFITGTTGTLNITMTDCAFEGVINEAVYSNADGAITLTNVAFSNLNKAVNLNHKAAGTQTVTINGCTFTNCGADVAADQIPVRVLSSVEGGKSVLSVTGSTFTGTPEGGADILLDYGVGLTTASVSGTAANVVVEKENNVGTTTAVKAEETVEFTTALPVAQVGETKYMTLAEAVAAATEGATITMLRDVELAEAVTIPAGKVVTLDLNGKTVSQSKECTASYAMITNDGSLTITGNGKLSFTDTSAGDPNFGWGSYTINNCGTLVVENGTIEHLGTQAFATHMICAIFQYSGSTTINGGTISTPSYRSARLWKGDMTINGGEFDGQLWVQAVDDSAKLTINGGTFAPNGRDASSVFVGNVDNQNNLYNVEFAVTDGTFTTKIGCSNAAEIAGDGIKGGKFTESAMNNTNSALLAEGFVFSGEVVDGYYGIEEKVELPEVVITDIKGSLTDSDPDLTFALNFAIKDVENLDSEYLEKLFAQYGDWYTDYVLTISGLTDENVTFNANGGGDGYLAGQYDAWSENWVSVPFEDVTLANGASIYIMEYAAKLMGQSGLRFTLAEVAEIVQNFDCGVYFTPEFLAANPGLKVDLHLKVFTEDAEGNKVNDINVATNNFDVEDYVAIVHAAGKQTKYCTTLADAVAAAADGATITMLSDVELTEAVKVVGKAITLDLNGKTVSGTCNAGQSSLVYIENNAALTVVDNSDAKDGKLTYAKGTSNVGWTVDVKGAFTLEAGTVELTGDNWSIGYAVDVRPNSWGTEYTNPSVFTMNGGKLVSSDGAVRVASSSAPAHKQVAASFEMNGGKIDAAWDGVFIQQSDAAYDVLNFTINDGTIESGLNPVRVYGPAPTSYVNGQECMSINFNGGTMTYTGTETLEWVIDGVLRVGGGSSIETIVENGNITASEAFAQAQALPEGYIWEQDGETYKVVEAPAIAKVGETKYMTLAEAVAAAQAGETVTLLADVALTESLVIAAGKEVVLDLNGKTVSMADASGKGAYAIKNNGNLTIVDNSDAKTGKITFNSTTPDNSFGYATSTIGNGGSLTVESGTIENTTVGGASYAIDGIWHTDEASLTINGGTIVANKIAVRQVPFSATANNVVTVNGGTLTGATAGLQLFNINNDAKLAEVNIHGGEFNGSYAFYTSFTSAAASEDVTINIDGGEFNGYLFLYNGNNGSDEYPMTVSVTGGTFNGGAYIYTKDANGDEVAIPSITGGTFANDVTVYCVDGYLCEANGDGTYGIVADPSYIAELIIDDAEGEPYTNDTEKTVGKLTYVRTLPAAGIWYPVFLPFDVPVAALDAELFDVARINDFHTNFSEEDGSIEKMWVEYIVRKSGTLAAGKPFLVRAKNSNVLEMVIELEDVTLYPADKKSTITVGSVITDVTFEGVYESLDAPVSTPSTRYLAVNAAGVWDEFDGYSLNPFRVMMTLQILDEEYYISSAASLSVGARVIGEENEDGTTTIYDVEVDRENCEDLIFDLQGRRVLEPEKGCIYIKNGKKIIF